ncbi:MAG: WD40 repeat domain-containing protein, partial [Kofleriaceae bacterium]
PYLAEVLRQGEDTPSIRFLLAEASRPLALQLGAPFVLRAGIHGTAWSADGKTVAVSSWRGDLVLLDDALRVRARLDVGDELIAFPTFTPDGTRLVAAGHRGDIMVFDVVSGRAIHRWDVLRVKAIRRPPSVEIAHLHVDDRHVAAVNHEGKLAVWDLTDGSERFALDAREGEPRATAAVVTADGSATFVGHDDGSIVRWNVATRAAVAELSAGADDVLQLRLASDDRLLGVTLDGAVHVWNHRTGASRATLGDSPKPVIFALDATEQLVATYGWDGTVRVFDAHTGQARATLLHPNGLYVRAVAFSPDGARLVTTGGDHAFRIWNTATGELEVLLESFAAAGDTPHSVGGAIDARFSPDGRVLLTASGTDLRRWRVTREPLITELDTGMYLYSAKWSPDERYIAAVGRGAAIFDAATGARVRSLDVPATRLLDVEWSRDGQHLVICGDERTALVFAADGSHVGSLDGHDAHVNGAVFSPDGAQLVTASDDGRAHIWDARTWAHVRTLAHPHRVLSATWSRDGALVVTAGWDRTLRIWNAATGALVRAIPGGTTQYLYASLSPDGRVVASAGHDGEVSLWSARTGARLRSLEGHTGPVTMIEWSPDGEMLATSGDEETTRLWDPATGQQLAIRRQPHSIMQVWWSADGTRTLTVSHAGTVRTWAVEREGRPAHEVLEMAASRSPWSLVDGRLVRAR